MRPMMEGLEGRTMFSGTAVSSVALTAATTITPAVPVSIGGKTVLPNQVFKGTLKLKDGGIDGETELPVTVAFASANGFSYTATLTITAKKLQGTQAISAAAPTDVFITKRKLTNSLTAFTDNGGHVNIAFTNFVHPKDATTGKFEAITKVGGSLNGVLSSDGKTFSGTFRLSLEGNKNHARTGTFSAKIS